MDSSIYCIDIVSLFLPQDNRGFSECFVKYFVYKTKAKPKFGIVRILNRTFVFRALDSFGCVLVEQENRRYVWEGKRIDNALSIFDS